MRRGEGAPPTLRASGWPRAACWLCPQTRPPAPPELRKPRLRVRGAGRSYKLVGSPWLVLVACTGQRVAQGTSHFLCRTLFVGRGQAALQHLGNRSSNNGLQRLQAAQLGDMPGQLPHRLLGPSTLPSGKAVRHGERGCGLRQEASQDPCSRTPGSSASWEVTLW